MDTREIVIVLDPSVRPVVAFLAAIFVEFIKFNPV